MTRLITLKQFKSDYNCSHSQLYREAKAGRLVIRKLGRASRIAFEDAEAWAANLPTQGGDAANG